MKVVRLLVLAALSLNACNNADLMSGQDRRLAKKAPNTPTFQLTNSQTCGVKPIEQIPEDPTEVSGIGYQDLAERLAGEGIEGWVHAAVKPFGEYVFSYRKPGEFFAHLEMAMIPVTPEAQEAFQTIKRNDQVHIVGKFVNKLSPLGHIAVSSLKVIEEYKPATPLPEYDYQTSFDSLMADLKKDDALYAVVHAQTTDGGVLVLEYKDAVLPVFVSENLRDFAKTLFRGDIVGVGYQIRTIPNQPPHIETKPVEGAIRVYDHMVWCHEKPATLTGELVLFQKSPQISTDVYALRHTDGNGMQRNWTLVGFSGGTFEAFFDVQEKLKAAWDAHASSAVNGRNQLINRKLKVTAKGTMNVVSPSQANPQIYLDSADDVTVEVVE